MISEVMSADPLGFPGLPGHLQERDPILVCNLFSLLSLTVTCDQLPSPTEQRYLCFPPPFGSVQSGYGDHVFSSVNQIQSCQAVRVSGSCLFPRTIPREQLRTVAFPIQLGRQCRTGADVSEQVQS